VFVSHIIQPRNIGTPLNQTSSIKGAASHLHSFMHHQRIAGDFDKPAGCKGGFNTGLIRM